MKKKCIEEKTDDRRSEYNLRELLKGGIQGKCAERYQKSTNMVVRDDDVADAFPLDESVNDALLLVIQLTKLPKPERGKKPKALTSEAQ